ncbi:MAG: Cof-type HAD-IIB family hydrolase [Defluviitaleaceae bacterium]|nr:Cof-type HAD-IIB family hydrolase [Defluviitaleaceae bacterium]
MKLIASDFDGTLSHHGVSSKDRDAIAKWRAAGNLFGIVTGRDHGFVPTIAEANLVIDFVIVYNGVDIYDLRNVTPVLLKRLMGTTHRMADLLPIVLRKKGDYADIVTPKRVYHFNYENTLDPKNENWMPHTAVNDIREFVQIYSLYESGETAMVVAEELNKHHADVVSALVNWHWLNAPPAGVNKATGVSEYARHMGVKHENIYAIGDSYNDMDMITAFNGYAMENGVDAIKNAANWVVSGVWELIELALAK